MEKKPLADKAVIGSSPILPPRKKSWLMSPSADSAFRYLTAGLAIFLLALVTALVVSMVYNSQLSLSRFGLSFVFSTTWDPVKEVFGALPFVYGTLISSLVALIISVPISLGVAIFLTE
ncbi:MAG: phosphate transport system permease protein, partial [bacterium]